MQANIHEAKTHLSKLIERAENGEEVIIARAGIPVVKLVRVEDSKVPRKPGLLKGKIWMSDDFDDEDPEINAMFEGKYSTDFDDQ